MEVAVMIALSVQRPHPNVVESCMTCEARAVSVCGAVGNSDLGRLAGLSTVIHVDSGFTFIEEGDTASHFFNVTAGSAKLYKLLPDGRRQIIDFARPGDFLGLAADRSYGFSAEALEPVRLCRFSRQKLTEMFNDFPAMERRLLATASHELLAAQEQMLLLGRKTARERVASFLRTEVMRLPACQRSLRMSLPMTRGDIGDYLGLTIETVSRTMTALRKSGVIDVPSVSDIRVGDFDALSRIANGSAIN
jgi:CRP/FNR family transcriptional regulator